MRRYKISCAEYKRLRKVFFHRMKDVCLLLLRKVFFHRMKDVCLLLHVCLYQTVQNLYFILFKCLSVLSLHNVTVLVKVAGKNSCDSQDTEIQTW